MNNDILVLLVFIIAFVCVQCYGSRSYNLQILKENNPDTPLYLTPLIEAGKIKKAQHLSKVKPLIGNVTSYSGYLTTNKKCGNNLFFWFFPAIEHWKKASVVLWLQGGPGFSSMYGLFEELGPFDSFQDSLQLRKYSWNIKNNLLFVDQPVGTGYSFTENKCYAENETVLAEDLYSAVVQFLKLFPNLQKNKFFIAGESFAGHYIPAIGYRIHNNNPTAEVKIHLAGMMIGNGWTSPSEQINYGDYLYQTGLIDNNERENFYYYQKQFVEEISAKNWSAAYSCWHIILGFIHQYSGVDVYNYLPQQSDKSNWVEFIQLVSTRKAIHVGSIEFNNFSRIAHDYLVNDMVQSVKPWVEQLLENYPIVFYVGQVDVICAYPMVINFLRSLKWSGQQDYLNAKRLKWTVNGEVAGYIKGQNNLFDVLVRDAGHKVPADQPFWAYQLVNSFIMGNNSDLFIGIKDAK